MSEEREGVAELVAVERPLRLPHHYRLEAALRVGQRGQEAAGFGPALGRDRAGLVDIKELGHDLAAVRFDQAAGASQLPRAGGFGVLVVLGGYPAPEG